MTVIKKGNRRYLKLFSPGLVESPQSFLDQEQLNEDKNLWENGPNAAFQKQLELEKQEAIAGKDERDCLSVYCATRETTFMFFSPLDL